MSDKIIILEAILRDLEIHAKESSPYECCGILGGTKDLISKVYWINNIHRDPRKHFMMDPAELLLGLKSFSQYQIVWRGVVHSHPRSQAIPSQTDLEFIPNLSPGMAYLIYSLSDQETNGYLTTETTLERVTVTSLR